jgi:hypothetical protein
MANTIRADRPEAHIESAVKRSRRRVERGMRDLADIQWAGTIAPTDPETEAKIFAALHKADA